MTDIYVHSMQGGDGAAIGLERYRGTVLLIVNVASKCGFTPQYTGLEGLQRDFGGRGFSVLGFPCNQFGAQEPGDAAAIAQFCTTNYGVTFPVMAKIDVNGPGAAPLYAWLKAQKSGLLGFGAIKWNFTKFLIDRRGHVVDRYAPTTTPEQLREAIEMQLEEP